jgi:hypothetical protein
MEGDDDGSANIHGFVLGKDGYFEMTLVAPAGEVAGYETTAGAILSGLASMRAPATSDQTTVSGGQKHHRADQHGRPGLLAEITGILATPWPWLTIGFLLCHRRDLWHEALAPPLIALWRLFVRPERRCLLDGAGPLLYADGNLLRGLSYPLQKPETSRSMTDIFDEVSDDMRRERAQNYGTATAIISSARRLPWLSASAPGRRISIMPSSGRRQPADASRMPLHWRRAARRAMQRRP